MKILATLERVYVDLMAEYVQHRVQAPKAGSRAG